MTPNEPPASPTTPPDAARRPAAGRRLLLFAVKVVAAVALLAWLARSSRLEVDRLRTIAWTAPHLGLVLAGVAGVLAGLGLLAWRLVLMLRSVDVRLGLGRAFALTAIGSFTGALLPGIVGGDVVKVVLLCRSDAADRRAVATAAVVVDRVVGFFGLFVLGTLALAAAWAAGALPFRSPVLLAAPTIVLAMLAAAAVESRQRFLARRVAAGGVRWLPDPVRVALGVGDHFAARPRLLAACVALSVANHLLVCGTFLVGAALLGGSGVSALQQILLNPLAMVLNAIPVTPGGVGVAEGAFSYLYAAAGCPLGATIGLVGRAVQYAAYVAAGLPAFLLMRAR